jgi:hypothetical protein
MTVTADSKQRVMLPSARPGDLFQVQDAGEGRFLLTKMAPVEDRPPGGRLEKRGQYTVLVGGKSVSDEVLEAALADFP